MDIEKEALFRMQIRDLRTNKSKVMTIYSNGEEPTLEEFKQKIVNCIKGDKK